MTEVKITDTKTLSNKQHPLQLVSYNFQLENRGWNSQTREVYDHGNAATVLLYNKLPGTVILIKQFRITTYLNQNATGMMIETCAGLLEKNESPEETIKREIEEETGYAINKVSKVLEVYTSVGSLTELLYLFTAEYSNEQKISEGGGLKEEGEELEVLELDFDTALRMIDSGEIKDAKTIILLQYAKLKQLL